MTLKAIEDENRNNLSSKVMNHSNTGKLERNLSWLRLMPYAAFGALAFSLTSAANLNYFVRGYVVLLEAQAGIVAIYFLMSKLARINKRKSE